LIGTIVITRITRALKSRRNELDANEKGFTLIELLVVVIIIGILAAIAIPVYMGIQDNAKDSAVKSDVGNLKTALVAYATDKGGSYTGATTANLGAYGYTEPAATGGNYGTRPAITLGASGFCVYAISVTGSKVGASDTSGVVSSDTTACSAGGVLTP
jgi:type IV pilus assembly protein PilA